MFSEHRIFQPSDPDAPTTPELRRRLAAAGRFATATPHKAPAPGHCRLCGCRIDTDTDADRAIQACGSCKHRAEARRLRLPEAAPTRGFTDAEKSLIRKIHVYVPATQLLNILNDRLLSDLGAEATPYTAGQLHAEIAAISATAQAADTSWAALRKFLARADRDGTLRRIDEQVINDFAVVFSLSPKHLMRLRDILLRPTED